MFKKKTGYQDPHGQDIQTPESPSQVINIDVKNL